MKPRFVPVGKSPYQLGPEYAAATAARGCGQVRSRAVDGGLASSLEKQERKAGKVFVQR
jgi:hypothetical protein